MGNGQLKEILSRILYHYLMVVSQRLKILLGRYIILHVILPLLLDFFHTIVCYMDHSQVGVMNQINTSKSFIVINKIGHEHNYGTHN